MQVTIFALGIEATSFLTFSSRNTIFSSMLQRTKLKRYRVKPDL
jgi:hypothetical protein